MMGRKSAVWSVFYTAQNAVFPLFLSVYLARILGPEGVGEVAWARNFCSYFTFFAAFGVVQYGVREVARTGAQGRVLRELAALNGAAVALGTVGYLFAVWRLYPQKEVCWVLALEVLGCGVDIDWWYRGKEELRFLALRNLAEKLVTLAMVFWLVRGTGDGAVYCLALCLGKGLGYLVSWLRAGRSLRRETGALEVRRHVGPALMMLVSVGAVELYSRVDITMLGLLGSAESVGFYANGYKIVNIVAALAAAVSGVYLPRLSRGFREGETAFREEVSAGLRTVLVLAVPCCVGLMLVAEDAAAALFGAEFAPAAGTVRILAALVPVKGIGDILCFQVLVSAGQEKRLAGAYLSAVLGNVVWDWLLIPRFGQDGAAVASVASEVLVVLLLLRRSLKIVRPKVAGRFFGAVLVGTAAMAATVLGLRKMEMGMVRLLASVTAGAAVYFTTVWMLGGMKDGKHKERGCGGD